MDKPRVVYGAINVSANGSTLGSSAIDTAIQAGNVNIGDHLTTEVLDLSETSKQAQEQHIQLMERYEADKKARKVTVPTAILDVKNMLRQYQQPITFFGENAADRRERLKQYLARRQAQGAMLFDQPQQPSMSSAMAVAPSSETPLHSDMNQKLFYIEMPVPKLKLLRHQIWKKSIAETKSRLKRERAEYHECHKPGKKTTQATPSYEEHTQHLLSQSNELTINASQLADTRPVAHIRVSPDGTSVASGSWSSVVKVWNHDLELMQELVGHEERITGLAWGRSSKILVSASADNSAKCWTKSSSGSGSSCSEPQSDDNNQHRLTLGGTLRGHQHRLAKVAVHPFERLVITASFDHTWRMWDMEHMAQVLVQEGHYCPVYAVACHPEGALVATGDTHGVARLWDIRSGKSIMSLVGHSKAILSLDFAAHSGGQTTLASGSSDHSVRIWELRKRAQPAVVLPAHQHLVSDVKFVPDARAGAEVLCTSSFDGTIRLWRTRDWRLLRELRGHEGKVMSVDVSLFHNQLTIFSSGYDRTVKQWRADEVVSYP